MTSAALPTPMELHDQAIVILAHDHVFGIADIEAMRRGGVTAKTVKLTVDGLDWDADGRRVEVPEFEGYLKRALVAVDKVYRFIEENPEKCALVLNADDILNAKQAGKAGMILGLEGPRPIEGSLEALRCLYRLGLREMQLTWASPNQLITEGRLNDLGIAVVRAMNELGILIDLSHLSDHAFFQVLDITKQPAIISHTACRSVSGPGDTITDEKIIALAENDGIIALHFVVGDYIRPRSGIGKAGLDDLIDHFDHIRSLVGIEHVALGGDYFPTAPGDTWAWVDGLDDISMMPNLTSAMVRRGYTDEEIRAVLGENLLRLYRTVWRSGGEYD